MGPCVGVEGYADRRVSKGLTRVVLVGLLWCGASGAQADPAVAATSAYAGQQGASSLMRVQNAPPAPRRMETRPAGGAVLTPMTKPFSSQITEPAAADAQAAPDLPTQAAVNGLKTPLSSDNFAAVQGVSISEIRLGMAGPFSGPSKDLGRNMKIGIETAFGSANEGGGVNGRQLKLVAADDGYEPARTLEMMKQLYERDRVFGFIGNVGTPTAMAALPYALEHKALFFGAFTGANALRRDPPDRYVFNYRPSYAEETEAVVNYLIRVRRLRPDQIGVFAQEDAYGDSGYAGVQKALRSQRTDRVPDAPRFGYKRNTADVADAVAAFKAARRPLKAIVMVASYRAAARFIEKMHDIAPSMIFSNVSFVGSTSLADELMLMGPKYANGVIVTQVVPAVDSYASAIIDYKAALQKYFPGEKPDYVSLEGYVSANLLINALKQAGPQLDTEKVVAALELLQNVDMGVGTIMNFGRSDHQASHKVWGTMLDETGRYQAIDLN